MSPELQSGLMRKIRDRWGAAIAAAVAPTDVPPGFLAALIANESGGDPTAVRFEPGTFASLAAVAIGKRAIFSPLGILKPIRTAQLVTYLTIAPNFAGALMRLYDLSTSWGCTQIMGWHAIEFGQPLEKIRKADDHLTFAVFLAAYFASRYGLDPAADFDKLFRCWNTGRPDGQTYDPLYVPNGMARMAAYNSL